MFKYINKSHIYYEKNHLRSYISRLILYSSALIPAFALLGLMLFPIYKKNIIGYVPVIFGIIIFLFFIYSGVLDGFLYNLTRLPLKIFLLFVIGTSILFRLPWVFLRMDPYSDHEFYLSLGKRIMINYDFGDMVLYPPGPFVYVAASMKIFGESKYAVGFMNIFLSVVVVILLYEIGKHFEEKTGRCASFLFAVIPSASVYAGGYGYENLLIFLLSVILILTIFENSTAKRNPYISWLFLIIIGLLCGVSALVHPPYLLIIACLGVAWWVSGGSLRDVIIKVFVMVFVASVVIFPWTYRNWKKFGNFCLISANAGTVLLSSNNPQSDGIYSDTKLITPILSTENQVSADKRRGKLAIQYIIDNPIRFGKLSIKRIVYMWGTDTSGLDFIIGHISRIKMAMSFLAQIFWTICILSWMIIAWKYATKPNNIHIELYMIQCILLIKFIIHSLLEPLSRHHLDIMPIILLLVAAGMTEISNNNIMCGNLQVCHTTVRLTTKSISKDVDIKE